MLNGIRRIKSAVSLVVIVQLMLATSGCGTVSTADAATSAKNVILIIADGMQLEHERAANNYLYGTPVTGLEHQTFPYKGAASTWDVTTYNRYAFGSYSTNGFFSKKYDDSKVDLNNTTTFDAMLGYNPAKGGRLPYRQDTNADIKYFSTKYKDSPANSANYPATDSASAGTALATGFKTDEGNVAWRTGDPANGRLTTIAEMYRNQKKAAIGVVSTVPFSHATPAAFVSHNTSRNNYKAIAQEIITGVRPDVVIAGGNPNYNDAAGVSGVNAYQYIDAPEYSNLKNSSEYKLVERTSGVDGGTSLLTAADTAVNGGKKLFGLFGGIGGSFEYHIPSNDGTAKITRGSIENPTLADASTAALKVLSRNNNGFFLMVEQGDIDWANHANDYRAMIGAVWDLNNAVKAVEAFVDKSGDDITWENTMVIVTSDHGNSYMRLQKDLARGVLPTQTPNGPGAPAGYDAGVSYYYDPSEVTYGFTGKGMNSHTNELVTLYAKGAGSGGFNAYEGLWYPGTRIVDNTHIYKVMLAAMGITDENRTRFTGARPTTFLYTSDAHYGIKRPAVFGSYSNAAQVNGLMVRSMNNMPNETLPCGDSGVNACQAVGAIDFVAMTGDIANRQESKKGIQSATTSWGQFKNDYMNNINLLDKNGKKAALFLTPGNHDVSNAIGYTKALLPATDDAVMFNLYNMFMNPATPLVAGGYNYSKHRIVYSQDIGGVHFVFLSMWPDSTIRPLIDANLAELNNPNMPVVLFTHDQPDIETKHLTSDLTTAGALDFSKGFENLVTDVVADLDLLTGTYTTSSSSTVARKGLADWLATKKNIVVCFHGNDNYTQNYVWTGTNSQISLNVFRVDSPMKGVVSGIDAADGKGDPSKLAYNVVTIDSAAQNMSVREYLWQQRKWGASSTVSLAPRSK